MSSLKDIINNFISNRLNKERYYSASGVVEGVSKNLKVCDVRLSTGELIQDVKLEADLKINASGEIVSSEPKGFITIPVTGSQVLVTFINDTDAFLAMVSEVDKLYIKADGIQFNDGSNGGLINVEDLVDRLNTIEGDMNDLKQIFSTWVPVTQDGGAALKGAAATWYSVPLTETKKSDIEDESITH